MQSVNAEGGKLVSQKVFEIVRSDGIVLADDGDGQHIAERRLMPPNAIVVSSRPTHKSAAAIIAAAFTGICAADCSDASKRQSCNDK